MLAGSASAAPRACSPRPPIAAPAVDQRGSDMMGNVYTLVTIAIFIVALAFAAASWRRIAPEERGTRFRRSMIANVPLVLAMLAYFVVRYGLGKPIDTDWLFYAVLGGVAASWLIGRWLAAR
jgi:hypothetical protein